MPPRCRPMRPRWLVRLFRKKLVAAALHLWASQILQVLVQPRLRYCGASWDLTWWRRSLLQKSTKQRLQLLNKRRRTQVLRRLLGCRPVPKSRPKLSTKTCIKVLSRGVLPDFGEWIFCPQNGVMMMTMTGRLWLQHMTKLQLQLLDQSRQAKPKPHRSKYRPKMLSSSRSEKTLAACGLARRAKPMRSCWRTSVDTAVVGPAFGGATKAVSHTT
mmetsp:Transcript_148699/g.476208  ORF Transcript_148699/g.476208 Transcript_148699/m.476208 type:complete len:215 (-) Transcript_148699:253-897(-)